MRLIDLAAVLTLLGLVVALPGRAEAQECDEVGIASYYCCEHHGRLTASGEPFNQYAMTAAHRSLPFGTMVRVTLGDRSVVVEITDRGPFTGERIIDLSLAAAEQLGMVQRGVAEVCLSWK